MLEFQLCMGLVHDPCPYLTDDGCDVYESRPLVCATFPANIFETYGKAPIQPIIYECLKGICVTRGQAGAARKAVDLLTRERGIEQHILGKPFATMSFPRCNSLGNFVDRAWRAQLKRDPEKHGELTQRLKRNAELIQEFVNNGMVNTLPMCAWIGHFVYSEMRDDIAERIEAVESDLSVHFASTTKAYQRLLDTFF